MKWAVYAANIGREKRYAYSGGKAKREEAM
jgi:hypothetical protein